MADVSKRLGISPRRLCHWVRLAKEQQGVGSEEVFRIRSAAAGPERNLARWPPGPLYKIRLNHSNDKVAESKASAAAAKARSPEISVSFFSTASRELRVS
jgi:hypothetical protein